MHVKQSYNNDVVSTNELLQSKFLGLFIVNHSQQSVNVRAASRLIRTEYKRLPNTVGTLE